MLVVVACYLQLPVSRLPKMKVEANCNYYENREEHSKNVLLANNFIYEP